MEFSHLDDQGNAKMVDITDKDKTDRQALAKGQIKMKPKTLKKILTDEIDKGPVFETARIAAIMAVKKTSDTIPMCHPISIGGIDVEFNQISDKQVEIIVVVRSYDKTGVEMEALHGVSTAALTIYDMCKAVDKDMVINNIRLVKKSGGKSGTYIRSEEEQ